MSQELELMIQHALQEGRVDRNGSVALCEFYSNVHKFMAIDRQDVDQPQAFEQKLLTASMDELRRNLAALA
jgi:glucosyl-3-phosphoglycerate synthase